jgi:RecA/RadA recombinase
MRRRVYVAACAVVDQLVRSSAVDVILVDSVAALVPQAEIEGEMGMVQVYASASRRLFDVRAPLERRTGAWVSGSMSVYRVQGVPLRRAP